MAETFRIPFSKYDSTRLDMGIQRRVNMYPNSKNEGMRQYPGLVEFSLWGGTGFTSPAYDSKSADITAKQPAYTLVWVESGTKLIVCQGGQMVLYTASTAYDISALTYVSISGAIDPGLGVTGTSDFRGGAFNNDGTQWSQCTNSAVVGMQALSTAYDPTTLAVSSGEYDFSAQVTTGSNYYISFSSDGLTFYIASKADQDIHQYTMTAPYDVTTASYASKTIDLSTNLGASLPKQMFISPVDRDVFIFADDGLIYQYFMETKGDISSATYVGSYDATTQITDTPLGITFNGDGTKFYLCNKGATDVIFQYTCDAYAIAQGATITGSARGAKKMNGTMYVVFAQTLYSVASTGAGTSLGTIVGSDIVGMSTDGTNLNIAAGGTKYNYTVAGGLAAISDTDLGDAYTSAFVDQRFYYDQINGQLVGSALNDPTDIDPLDKQTAESFNDDLLAVISASQLIYALGQTTTEIFATSGLTRPLLRRQKVINHGIIGKRSVAMINNVVYVLDDERRPGRMLGLDYQQMYVPALGAEFDSYSTVDDCIINTYTWEQENFIEYAFPTQGISWTLHENSGEWTKREDTNNTRFNAAFYVNVYNKLLAVDYSNGKVYSFSDTTYQDNGNSITRTLDSQLINSALLGIPDQNLSIARTRIAYECSGSTSITVSCSRDNDIDTFAQSQSFTINGSGVLMINRFPGGKLREGIIRITTTSNTRCDILSLSIDATVQRDTND